MPSQLEGSGLRGALGCSHTLSTCFSVFYSLHIGRDGADYVKDCPQQEEVQTAHGIPNDVLSRRVLIAFEGYTG